MRQINDYKFDNRDMLFQKLLQDVMGGLSSALDKKSRASMLLSGGTSPGALYQMMAEQELDWSKVWFGLSDERWVSPDHPDSNEKLVGKTLLTGKAVEANFIGLKSAGQDVVQGSVESNRLLKGLPMPFDIVLLGMGLDGHTASLFPDSADTPAALEEGNKMLCHPIRRAAGDVPRISMTLNSLVNSEEIKLLIFGASKWEVYQQARAEKSDSQPVSHLLHQTKTPVSVYWAP